MSLYAYLPYEEGKKGQHQTGEVFHYQGDEVWLFQSTKMTSEERSLLKKQDLDRFKCFACGEDMTFIANDNNNKNNYFRHLRKKDCVLPESFEHAITKLKIYNLFKEAGYTPKLERPFENVQANYKTRADVFVEAITGNEKLVVEVQGDKSILPNTIAKRTMTYATEEIPTAWVLILDSYFEQYAGTTVTEVVKHKDGTSSNEVRPLRYNEDDVFIGTGTPKSFNQLMDAYGYVVGVNYDGHFFLIRQNVLEKDDTYKISRIPHENLVEVLLATDLVALEYHYEPKKKVIQEKGHFQGVTGFDHEEEMELLNTTFNDIDFEMAYQIEMERLKNEGKLDPLFLIQQVKAVREFKQREYERELLAVQREMANERKYKKQIANWNKEVERVLMEKERLNDLIDAFLRQKEEQGEAIDKRIQAQSQIETKKRDEILAEIRTMEQKDGKKTRQAIEEVKKIYGDFDDQTGAQLERSLKQIEAVYLQEQNKKNQEERKKSIEQAQLEERRYKEEREWRLF